MSIHKIDMPLSGITVVDLSRVLAGPYCTMMLADLGARVIKIENPDGGDDSRQVGPFVDGESVYFASINRHKESIALDLKDPEDRAKFENLLSRADVLVENFRPGVMGRLGYGWEQVRETHPQLVYASISGFGQTGPYRNRPAYDMVVQAMGGIMSVTGQPDGRPIRVGVSIGDIAAGLYATIGIQAALARRAKLGVGDRVDISMLDCQVALMENPIARYSATNDLPTPLGARHASITPFDAFKTADGFMVLAVGNDALFKKMCAAINRATWATDERFCSLPARNAHHHVLKEWLEHRFMDEPNRYWKTVFEAAGVPHGTLDDVKDLLASEQVNQRAMLLQMKIGVARQIQVAGSPIKLESVRPVAVLGKAPALDEHRAEILFEFGNPSART